MRREIAPDSVIDRAIAGIADDAPLDWEMLVSQARSNEERELLQCLRIVGDVAQLHRSTHDPLEAICEDRTPAFPAAVSEPPPHDSETWGKYRLLEKVGEGTFGDVFRAWDPDLEWEIAIKILRRDIILPEARALAQVRHPNVVSVYGVEAHGDRLGLCMEFLRGETLEAERKRRGMLGEREARLIGEDVCRALAAVHGVKVVHRDVKARNVMRDQTGRIVLMDFGTVCHDGLAGAVTVAGTPLYMAPEVLLSNEPASVASDVYSVGVLLYYLVTGAYPVEGDSIAMLKEAHGAGRRRLLIDRRPDLPMSFIHVVERALAADPRQRYPSAGALLSALSTGHGKTRHLAASVLAVACVGGGLTVLGALSTRYFNATLGRSDFADETVGDWFKWGAMSVLAPAVLCAFALAGIAVLLVCKRMLFAASAKARSVERTLFEGGRFHLDSVPAISSAALLMSLVVLSAAWWYYSPLLGALVNISPDISKAPAESLALLSPRFSSYHETYRATFVWVTIVCVVLWYPAVRLAAMKGERLSKGIVAGGVAVVLLALALLDFPYRLLYHSDFEAATWQDATCFVLGEGSDDLLLFCPEFQVPRSRTVKKGAPGLVRRGFKENIFTHFSADEGGQP
jgi:hypothetical protein